MSKIKKRIYLGDLSYFSSYSSHMLTIPLNIGYIASYLLKDHDSEFEVSLFKDPRRLLLSAKANPPDVLGLSCYYWNTNLDILVANRIKQLNRECAVVVGGPNIDTELEEQLDLYLSFKGSLDLMVLNEGELGFSNIITRLLSDGVNRCYKEPIDGCVFFTKDNEPVFGKDVGLSLDLETLPSPVLSGILDQFLTSEFMPIIQTSRMCPYSCAYCCSGKLKGKIRRFPDPVVKDEIEYIAKKNCDNPHRIFYITDENFGINKRDSMIAKSLVDSKKRFGYPQQTYCYFDKKLTPTVKEVALLLADMNSGGVQLASQSFNEDSLKAVKRRNISHEDMIEAVRWAKKHGLKTSSEMIFGLPFETKQSFLDALELQLQMGIDTNMAHNLFLLKGIELNRRPERERFRLSTKYRPSNSPAYDMIDGEFVCESEEVVVSSSHFSFDDFMDIRKISLIFYILSAVEYFRKVIDYLIGCKQEVIPLLDSVMNPSQEDIDINGYAKFLDDFLKAVQSELFDSHKDAFSHLRKQFINSGNNVTIPTRLIPYYASRLIYMEGWFPEVISRLLSRRDMDAKDSAVLRDLIAISENEWIDIRNPERGKEVVVCGQTLDYLDIPRPAPEASRYRLKMTPSEEQKNLLVNYNKQFLADDDSYYYNVLNYIQPRKNLRYGCISAEPVVEAKV